MDRAPGSSASGRAAARRLRETPGRNTSTPRKQVDPGIQARRASKWIPEYKQVDPRNTSKWIPRSGAFRIHSLALRACFRGRRRPASHVLVQLGHSEELARGGERPAGQKRVDVRVPVQKFAVGLDGGDHAGRHVVAAELAPPSRMYCSRRMARCLLGGRSTSGYADAPPRDVAGLMPDRRPLSPQGFR